MKPLHYLLLLCSFTVSAQVPTDFVHVYDSITLAADPAINSIYKKQVMASAKSFPTKFWLPRGKFRLATYTLENARPVERYVHFSGFRKDSIDTSYSPTVNIEVITNSFLVTISKSSLAGATPCIRIGSVKYNFFTSGNYFYAYLRRTQLNQVFKVDFDSSNDPAKMVTVDPIPGKSVTLAPNTQGLTITINNPFE